ncbi:MAG: sigma-70 family RNA polymerase sigma factor [Gammaproteobacteria bacterium]|nr:sigma-70 family RNA polymerase sigma factor [Gammaproteobacteria bacterium]
MNNNTNSTDGSARLAEWIGRCALGDEAAFVALYRATSAKLFGVVLRILKTRHWAEEVLQEGYMNIWRHAGSYNLSRGAPMTWMINIARNQALDFLRRSEYRALRHEHLVEQELLDESDQPAQVLSAELERLHRCLDGLAEAQRRCLLLVHHEGFSPIEVAQRQGLPLGTVKTWVRRGLLRLRECLGA